MLTKDWVVLNRYARLATSVGDKDRFKPGDVVAVKSVRPTLVSLLPVLAHSFSICPAKDPQPTPTRSSSSASSPSPTASSARSPPTRNRPCASRQATAGSRATSASTRATRTRSDRSRSGWSRARSSISCGRRGESSLFPRVVVLRALDSRCSLARLRWGRVLD